MTFNIQYRLRLKLTIPTEYPWLQYLSKDEETIKFLPLLSGDIFDDWDELKLRPHCVIHISYKTSLGDQEQLATVCTYYYSFPPWGLWDFVELSYEGWREELARDDVWCGWPRDKDDQIGKAKWIKQNGFIGWSMWSSMKIPLRPFFAGWKSFLILERHVSSDWRDLSYLLTPKTGRWNQGESQSTVSDVVTKFGDVWYHFQSNFDCEIVIQKINNLLNTDFFFKTLL